MLVFSKQGSQYRAFCTLAEEHEPICPPAAAYGVPYSQLTPDQRACLTPDERSVLRDAADIPSALF